MITVFFDDLFLEDGDKFKAKIHMVINEITYQPSDFIPADTMVNGVMLSDLKDALLLAEIAEAKKFVVRDVLKV
ncbi:MAG: hypothetical protein V4642_04120 [Bacteroidota bacterium]